MLVKAGVCLREIRTIGRRCAGQPSFPLLIIFFRAFFFFSLCSLFFFFRRQVWISSQPEPNPAFPASATITQGIAPAAHDVVIKRAKVGS